MWRLKRRWRPSTGGGLTGDTSEQLKGKAREMEGKAQRKVGEAEDDIDRDR